MHTLLFWQALVAPLSLSTAAMQITAVMLCLSYTALHEVTCY